VLITWIIAILFMAAVGAFAPCFPLVWQAALLPLAAVVGTLSSAALIVVGDSMIDNPWPIGLFGLVATVWFIVPAVDWALQSSLTEAERQKPRD